MNNLGLGSLVAKFIGIVLILGGAIAPLQPFVKAILVIGGAALLAVGMLIDYSERLPRNV